MALKRIWGVIFVCLLPGYTLRDAFKILTRIAKTGSQKHGGAFHLLSVAFSSWRVAFRRGRYIYTYIHTHTRDTFERVRLSATLCTIATTTKYVHTRRTCPRTFRHTELRGQKEIDRVVLISRIQQTAPSASRSFLSNFTLLLHLTPISRFLLHVFHRIRLVFWMEFGELYPYNTPFDSFSSYPTVFSFSISFLRSS